MQQYQATAGLPIGGLWLASWIYYQTATSQSVPLTLPQGRTTRKPDVEESDVPPSNAYTPPAQSQKRYLLIAQKVNLTKMIRSNDHNE
ncbi:hypothetical protein AAY77_15315 [Providencia rettgeri]|nr:hypothetical protein AAY77_15315 [Providencia rettgeri]